MKIKDIRHLENNKTRSDDRYPLRIGSTIELLFPPAVDECMCMRYIFDRFGNPKTGFLVTSTVTGVAEMSNEIIVETLNSIYILEK